MLAPELALVMVAVWLEAETDSAATVDAAAVVSATVTTVEVTVEVTSPSSPLETVVYTVTYVVSSASEVVVVHGTVTVSVTPFTTVV